jgi:hypothetical protein
MVEPKKVIDEILDFGIYYVSLKIKYDPKALTKQFIYWAYRYDVPESLQYIIDSRHWEYVGKGVGFDSDGFEPWEEEVKEVDETFEADPELKERATEYYRFRLTCNLLNIRPGTHTFDQGKELVISMQKGGPMPMANVDRLFYFRDPNKPEFDLIQFMAFIGIKSIVGKKPFCKTNLNHIRARMFGYSRHKDVPEKVTGSKLYRQYATRYHMDKLMESLKDNWHVKAYCGHTRGLYIGVGEDLKYETLIETAERSKRKNKKTRRMAEIKAAEARVRAKF